MILFPYRLREYSDGSKKSQRSLSATYQDRGLVNSLHDRATKANGRAFFTDNKKVIKIMESPSDWLAFHVYLEDLERSEAAFMSFSISYLPRLNNSKVIS